MTPEDNRDNLQEPQEQQPDFNKEIKSNRIKRDFNKSEIKVTGWLTALTVFFEVCFLLLAFLPRKKPSDVDAGAKAFYFVCAIGVCVVLYFLFKHLYTYMKDNDALDKEYLAMLPVQEAQVLAVKYRKKKITGRCVVIIALCCLIVPPSVVGIVKNARYHDAVELVFSGAYDDAITALEPFEDSDYRDAKALICYCEAHKDYNNGYFSSAYFALYDTQFKYVSNTQRQEIKSFNADVERKRDVEYAETEIRKERELRERIRTGIPFIGMPEDGIADTTLGAPYSIISHGDKWVGSERRETNLYYFLEKNKISYLVECYNNKVINVWDSTNIPPKHNYIPSARDNDKSYPSPKGDPYDVDDYDNADDFYYDHYDDFYEFEDAENYFDEHH